MSVSEPAVATERSTATPTEDGLVFTIGPRHVLAILGLGLLAWLVALLWTGRLTLPAMDQLDESASLGLIFFAGLSIGGLSCMAVQGGLLAAMIARRESQLREDGTQASQIMPVMAFLGAKLVAYTALGALLGLVGSKIPGSVQAMLLIAVGLFMVVVVLQMFDVHPIVRRVAFTPPKAVQRFVRHQSRRSDALGPLALGALTVFIPCGVTLAMEGLAITSESATRGAAILGAFTLGTTPLFVALALVATRLSRIAYRVFQPVAAVTILIVAVMSMISGARLLGFGAGWVEGESVSAQVIMDDSGAPAYQEAHVQVLETAYEPNRVQLKAGLPTQLQLVTEDVTGCTRTFTIPHLGVDLTLPIRGTEIVELPAMEPGDYVFTCGMAMFSGAIEVVP